MTSFQKQKTKTEWLIWEREREREDGKLVKNEKAWDDGQQCLCTNCWQDAVQSRGKANRQNCTWDPDHDAKTFRHTRMPDRGNKTFPAPWPKEIPRASAENPQMNPKAKQAKQAPQHCTRKSEEAISCTTGFFQANGDPSCELRASWRLKKLHELFFPL